MPRTGHSATTAPPKKRGAPYGNLNALKTGSRSKQFRAFIGVLLLIPETRRFLRYLSRMQARDAARLLAQLDAAVNADRERFTGKSQKRSIAALRRSLSLETQEMFENAQTIQSPAITAEDGQ